MNMDKSCELLRGYREVPPPWSVILREGGGGSLRQASFGILVVVERQVLVLRVLIGN